MIYKTITGKTVHIDKFNKGRYNISIYIKEIDGYKHLAFIDEEVLDLFIQCFIG